MQDFPHGPSADSCIIHFDRQFSGLFRVLFPFRFNRVIYAALLTSAALASRSVVPCLYLVLCLSTFRAFFPCLFFLFPHAAILSYYLYFVSTSLSWSLLEKARFMFYFITKKGFGKPKPFRESRVYSTMLETTPEATVRPPSRIAKRSPSSIAIGVISVISMRMLSPGITISTPSGSLIVPVTSVVRK